MASPSETMDIVLAYGREKISVHLDVSGSEIEGDNLTVHHLAKAVEKATKIVPDSQRLIHRGKTLFKTFDPDGPHLRKTLSSLGITKGARVMVLGKPGAKNESSSERKKCSTGGSREEDNAVADRMRLLDEHQSKINDICELCTSTVEKMKKEPGDIDEGKQLVKFFLIQSEYSMKELTKLDATPGGVSDEYRARRKALVNQLLNNVSLCDQQVDYLNQRIKKSEKQHGDPGEKG